MDELITKLTEVLSAEFPGSKVELPTPDPDEKLSGFVVWEGFEGSDQLDRQGQVSRVLNRRLTKAERSSISAIFATTPVEMAGMRAG